MKNCFKIRQDSYCFKSVKVLAFLDFRRLFFEMLNFETGDIFTQMTCFSVGFWLRAGPTDWTSIYWNKMIRSLTKIHILCLSDFWKYIFFRTWKWNLELYSFTVFLFLIDFRKTILRKLNGYFLNLRCALGIFDKFIKRNGNAEIRTLTECMRNLCPNLLIGKTFWKQKKNNSTHWLIFLPY